MGLFRKKASAASGSTRVNDAVDRRRPFKWSGPRSNPMASLCLQLLLRREARTYSAKLTQNDPPRTADAARSPATIQMPV